MSNEPIFSRPAGLSALALTAAISAVVSPAPAQAQDGRAITTFSRSQYNYCDAKLIGALFQVGTVGGKVAIGQKIQNGIGSNIPLVLRESRAGGNRCAFEDTEFTYEDAEILAGVWGLNTPYQAKLKVARYATNGQTGIVRRALGR
ncbi:MAG: hypothetical protein EON93_04355 [Burkholderiales bacterium]|nr:MAG: hypothetical protein EON93_04355 [Burkholderiales bacterium]